MNNQTPSLVSTLSTATSCSRLSEFPLLAAKLAEHDEQLAVASSSTSTTARPIRSHLNQYIADIQSNSVLLDCDGGVLDFWIHKQTAKSTLQLVAQDFLSAPASQAFVERLFSVCGLLTSGRRNRMSASLSMRAWLKVNHEALKDMGL